MLKSIAAAERDRNFRTEHYEFAALELNHPQNLISVAPLVGKVPPPLPGETRVTKLSDAMYTALCRARNEGTKGRKGCSIVVHEGVYVDALTPAGNFPKEFSLEIVGVKNVRLIFETVDCFMIRSLNLTLKNVSVFDRRLNLFRPTIVVGDGACVQLNHANVHSPKAVAIYMNESKLSLVRTSFAESNSAVVSMKSDLHLTDCVIDRCSSKYPRLVLMQSKCVAKSICCSSGGAECISFDQQSKGTIEDCKFEGPHTSDDSRCLLLRFGSHVFVR